MRWNEGINVFAGQFFFFFFHHEHEKLSDLILCLEMKIDLLFSLFKVSRVIQSRSAYL